MNPSRLLVIANNVFWEVIRDRVLYLLGFFALFLAASVQILPEVAAATEDKMFLDVGLGAMSALGLIVAVFVGTGLINKEIEKRTVYILIAKPMSISEFIIGKYIGLSTVIFVLVAAMMGIYWGLLELNQIPYPSLTALIVSAGFLVLELSLITAAAILFGAFTSSLIATLLTFGIYFMGHLSQATIRWNQLVENPGFKQITETLFIIVPDLSRLNLKNLAVYGMAALPDPLALVVNAGYGIVYIIALLAMAIVIFSRQEF